MAESLVAAVELGGTKCVCLLASGPGDVRDEARIDTTAPARTLGAVRAVLERWRVGPGFAALGVAGFGPLDLDPASPGFGRVTATPKPGWSGADLRALGDGFGVPLALDTDVNAAALAEGRWGAARGLDSYAYVTLGTGLGVGAIVRGRPVAGLWHSEAGHMRVPRLAGDDWPGACPYHGDCAEGLASGTAIQARTGRPASELAPDDPSWDSVAAALGHLFCNLTLSLGCRRILVGGGVAMGQPHLAPRVRAALLDSLGGYAMAARVAVDIDSYVAPPGLGDRAGPLGAVALALDTLG